MNDFLIASFKRNLKIEINKLTRTDYLHKAKALVHLLTITKVTLYI